MTWTLGIDIGGTQTKSAAIDADGKVHGFVSEPTARGSTEALERQLVRHAERLRRPDVTAIGIALPGSIDPRTDEIHVGDTNLPIHGFPVTARFSAVIGVPVVTARDANAALVGEVAAGSALGHTDVVMLTLGTGVGGSVLTDGRLIHGPHGGAGELGHLVVADGGRKCLGVCRGAGHLEAYASASAIETEAAQRARRVPDTAFARHFALHGRLTPREVAELAQAGDPVAVAILTEVGHYLSVAVETLAYVFQPQVAVIGGGIAKVGGMLFDEVRRVVNDRLPEVTARGLEVRQAQLGDNAGVIGAAVLARAAQEPTVRTR